ncbi:MAG: type II toxin-antitoxin system Phd/YefM family antitoxin [Deltaproteobacteria bacterium]|nr:type II toxin-antitoxin system Phd/YefM family antitoxin [Deltaproteobacteria bacterium]
MKGTPKIVDTVTAKNQLNTLIAEINTSKTPVVVKRRGELVAVIIDYHTYTGHKEKQSVPHKSDTLMRDLKSWHKTMGKKYPKGTGDSADILHQIRQQRHNHD